MVWCWRMLVLSSCNTWATIGICAIFSPWPIFCNHRWTGSALILLTCKQTMLQVHLHGQQLSECKVQFKMQVKAMWLAAIEPVHFSWQSCSNVHSISCQVYMHTYRIYSISTQHAWWANVKMSLHWLLSLLVIAYRHQYSVIFHDILIASLSESKNKMFCRFVKVFHYASVSWDMYWVSLNSDWYIWFKH